MSENFGTYQQKEKMLKDFWDAGGLKTWTITLTNLVRSWRNLMMRVCLNNCRRFLSERDEISRQLQGLE